MEEQAIVDIGNNTLMDEWDSNRTWQNDESDVATDNAIQIHERNEAIDSCVSFPQSGYDDDCYVSHPQSGYDDRYVSSTQPRHDEEINVSSPQPNHDDEFNVSSPQPMHDDGFNVSSTQPRHDDEFNVSSPQPRHDVESNVATDDAELSVFSLQPKKKRSEDLYSLLHTSDPAGDYTLYVRDDLNGHKDIIAELQSLIDAITLVSDVCVREKRHLGFHISALVVELLYRRLDYVRHSGKITNTRMTYPSYVLVAWLKSLYLRSKRLDKQKPDVPNGICEPTCNARFDVPPRNKLHNMSYLLGAPYTCGPSKTAPISYDSQNMDDMYELKYLYLGTRLMIFDCSFGYSHPAMSLIFRMHVLLEARHKCRAGFDEKLSSFMIEYNRLQFYNTLEEYKSSLLNSFMEVA